MAASSSTLPAPGGAPAGHSSSSSSSAQHQPQTGTTGSSSTSDDNNKSLHQKGRGKIPWSKEVWDRIDNAVEMEVKRTRVGARFLPKRLVPPKTTSVPSDAYTATVPAGGTPVLTVDEGATLRLNEYYVEFELTPQQVDQEEGDFKTLGHSTAVTLATKAANTLAQAEDLIIFQGNNATSAVAKIGSSLFTANFVLTLNPGGPTDTGLLAFPVGTAAPAAAATNVVPVPALGGPPGVVWGSNTFEAVAQAYALLQGIGHYGPYALVLETIPYADTFAPLPATLTLTADRIKPLMTAGFFGTGTIPPNPPPPPAMPPVGVPPFFGAMVSVGGNTVDLVFGLEPLAAFMQEDTNGNFRFRVLERFALRVKDPAAIVVLQFN
jgi:uncharacterized linocin/CFP29 family protein